MPLALTFPEEGPLLASRLTWLARCAQTLAGGCWAGFWVGFVCCAGEALLERFWGVRELAVCLERAVQTLRGGVSGVVFEGEGLV